MSPNKDAKASIRPYASSHLEIFTFKLCSLHNIIQTSSKGLEVSLRQTDFTHGIVMLSLFTHRFRLLKRKAIPIFHCCRTNFLRQLDTCLCVPSGCHNFRCLKSADPPLRPTQCTAPLISQHNPVWFLTAPGSAALQPVMRAKCVRLQPWCLIDSHRLSTDAYMPHISRQPRCPSYFLPNTLDWLPSSCLIFTFHICLPKKTTKLLCLECYQENSWEWNW